MTSTIINDHKQINKQIRTINHKIVPPIPLEDLYKRKSTAITRFFHSNPNKIVPSTTYNTYRHNNICQHKTIHISQVNNSQMEIDSNPSLHSKIHTEPIDLPNPTTTNNIIITKSYDNSKHSVTPIIKKNNDKS